MKNLLIAAIALMLVSCNRSGLPTDSSLLSSVPADTRAVAVADLYACAREVGLRISSEGLLDATSSEADLSFVPRNVTEPIKALARRRHWVDLSHVAIFADSATGAIVFTAMRIDGAETTDENENPHVAVFVDDNRLWVASKPFDAADLDSIAARASRRSVADIRPFSDFLSSYRPVRAALRPEPFRNVAGDDFTTIFLAAKSEGNMLSVDITYADSLGNKVDPFSRLSGIDENVYSYLPQATVATLAIGADRHTFRSILSNYGGVIPLRQRMAAELSSGFLCDSASTIAVGFAPGGSAETISDFSLKTWVFTALLPIEIDRTEDFIDIIDILTQGSLQCDIAGPYLAVSNASLEQVASGDDYGTVPSPSLMRLQGYIPYRSELMKALRLDFGLSLDADCTGGKTSIRLSTLGGEDPPGTIILDLLRGFPHEKYFWITGR